MPPSKRVIGFTVLDKERKKRYTRLAIDLGADVVDETVRVCSCAQFAMVCWWCVAVSDTCIHTIVLVWSLSGAHFTQIN